MKKAREVIVISGRTGTGKSYLARSVYSLWSRRVIYDPQREHGDGAAGGLHAFKGFHVPVYDAEHAARLAMDAGNCLLVLDDAYAFVRHPLGEELKKAVNTGRHRAVSILVVTQRVPDVAPDLRAQVDLWVAFKTTMASDRRTLAVDWGLQDLDALGQYEYRVQSYTEKRLRVAAVLTLPTER